jgi:hypothetical protein
MSDTDFFSAGSTAACHAPATGSALTSDPERRAPTVDDSEQADAPRPRTERQIDCSLGASGGYWDVGR